MGYGRFCWLFLVSISAIREKLQHLTESVCVLPAAPRQGMHSINHIDDLLQGCPNPGALAMGLLSDT